MIELHPEFLMKNCEKQFAVLPYEEFLKIKELLKDLEDLRDLRNAKNEEKDCVSVSFAERKITYGDIEQRWLVVQSQDRKKSDFKKLSEKIEKVLINTQTKLKKLAPEKFACAADARKENFIISHHK